jgi:aspartyl-tRNA(Asn)/glutamyl-tRNA(Gln) amidotransferase subunit B
VAQETRSFDADTGTTRLLRSKEEAHDYRYFPEPDLPPLVVTAERLDALRAELPELPWPRQTRLAAQYGLPAADARVLTLLRELADYYEAAAAALPTNPKGIANWVQGEVLRDVRERRTSLAGTIAPARLAALVALVDAGTISNSAAKAVFAAIAPTGEEPAAAVERMGLAQVSDSAEIERWIDEVIARSPAQVAQYRAGKVQIVGFLVGQVMKRSGGRADPKAVQQMMKQALEREPVPDLAD